MKNGIKLLASEALNKTGLIRLLRHATASRGGLVLALHRVLPVEEWSSCYDPHLALSEPAFVSLLRLLQRDYDVVPLREMIEDPRGHDGRPKVAITFDDGWEDNYRVAFPHLLAHQLPATIFVCADLIDTAGMLPEERFARLWNECVFRSKTAEFVADLAQWGIKPKIKTVQWKHRIWSEELKRSPLSTRLLLLDHFERRYPVPRRTRRFLGWDDLRIMMKTGLIEIGSHTSRHASLTSEVDRDVRHELEMSRQTIAHQTGKMASLFAYPNGKHNPRVQRLVHSTGFMAAVSSDPGMLTRRSNRLAIPRVPVDDPAVLDTNARFSAPRASVHFVGSWIRPVISRPSRNQSNGIL